MENPEVDGHPDLTRDSGSGAIINRNTYSYQQYMESYKKRIEKENRLDNLEQTLLETKKEIDTIKDLILRHIMS
jgi:hypothetical protein|tara:strand:+ start:349 stop:570 length:222 start_codon:yes stop_codon:yes gene_type:complete